MFPRTDEGDVKIGYREVKLSTVWRSGPVTLRGLRPLFQSAVHQLPACTPSARRTITTANGPLYLSSLKNVALCPKRWTDSKMTYIDQHL